MSVLTKEESAWLDDLLQASGRARQIIDRLCGLLETSVQTKDAIRVMGEQRRDLLAKFDLLWPHVVTHCACCDNLRAQLKAMKNGWK